MYESISKNNELENEMTLDMSYFWYSDDGGLSGRQNAPSGKLTQYKIPVLCTYLPLPCNTCP